MSLNQGLSLREIADAARQASAPASDNAGANLSDSQSWDMYSYVGGNPTSRNDPLGLFEHVPSGCATDSTGFGYYCPNASGGFPSGFGFVNPIPRPFLPGGDGRGHYLIHVTSTAPAPNQAPSGLWARLNCASDYGDAHSIAAGIYAGKGKPDFVTNLFFGNAVSAFTNLFLIVAGERAPTAESFATHSLIGVGQGIPAKSPVVKGPAGVIQDAAVGGAYTAVRGLNDAPITGITGAAFEAGGEGAATAAEGFAFTVGFAKVGFDAATFGVGLIRGCAQ